MAQHLGPKSLGKGHHSVIVMDLVSLIYTENETTSQFSIKNTPTADLGHLSVPVGKIGD